MKSQCFLPFFSTRERVIPIQQTAPGQVLWRDEHFPFLLFLLQARTTTKHDVTDLRIVTQIYSKEML
jgi:hypothetical protein